jgi:hypothetical protein
MPWTLDGEYGGEPCKAVITNNSKAVKIRIPNEVYEIMNQEYQLRLAEITEKGNTAV